MQGHAGSLRRGPTAASRFSTGVLVVLALLTAVRDCRVGDAGAKAAWSGRLSSAAAHGTVVPAGMGANDHTASDSATPVNLSDRVTELGGWVAPRGRYPIDS
jgi:hypothetical protein